LDSIIYDRKVLFVNYYIKCLLQVVVDQHFHYADRKCTSHMVVQQPDCSKTQNTSQWSELILDSI